MRDLSRYGLLYPMDNLKSSAMEEAEGNLHSQIMNLKLYTVPQIEVLYFLITNDSLTVGTIYLIFGRPTG